MIASLRWRVIKTKAVQCTNVEYSIKATLIKILPFSKCQCNHKEGTSLMGHKVQDCGKNKNIKFARSFVTVEEMSSDILVDCKTKGQQTKMI